MFRLMLSLVLFLVLICLCLQKTRKDAATLTRSYGKVQMLLNPSKKKRGPSPHALYNGRYYNVKKAKKGMKFPLGSVIKTGKSAKAKLVYANGDQISVGSESFLKITRSKSMSASLLDLFSGSIRAIVEKKGNRNRVEVRTKSMTMGVRGTDFYVDAQTASGNSKITVIRGKVVITPSSAKTKEYELKSGYSMDIKTKAKPIVLTRNTKSSLKKIYESTSVKKQKAKLIALKLKF